MARTTTVTHPDGTVSKRTSANRVYTHAVVEEISRETLIADARRSEGHADAAVRLYSGLVATMTEADVTEKRRSWSSGDVYVDVYVSETWLASYVEPRDSRPSLDDLRAAAQKRLDNALEHETKRRANLAAVEAATGPEYGVLRWSARRDLAEKAAAGEFSRLVREGVRVYVVEVDA